MITRRKLIRNTALGSAGLALLPFTEHMQAHAAGNAGQLPKRFMFVTTVNGIDPGYLIPESKPGRDQKGGYHVRQVDGVDSVVDVAMGEVGLPVWLKSLEPFIERTTCVTGLSGKMCRGWHSAGYGALGAHASGDKGKPAGETIDAALAKALPSIFQHIGVSATRPLGISAWDAGVPIPQYDDPIEVYNNLFGVISGDARAHRRNRFNGRLFDFMADDIKRFERSLPGEEREKLGHYLGAFENMSSRHQQLLAKKAELERLNPKKPEGPFAGDGAVSWEDKYESMCDLVVQAMIAGLTNVATINADCGMPVYGKRSGFDVPKGGHGFGHGPTSQRVRPFSFCVSMVAKMAAAFEAVPEGNGTMLDNTLFLILSQSGSTHHTKHTNWPMLLVGNCGGKLRMGRHIHYPGHGKTGNATIGSMYTTLLHAADAPRDGFGQLDASTAANVQKRPLAELMV